MKICTYTNGPVNYSLIGSPTIEDNIATGFSTNDYIKLNTPFLTGNNNWEIVTYVKVSSFSAKCTFISYGNTSTRSVQVGSTTSGTLNIYLSSNGTSANIANGTLSTNTIQLNTWYYVMVRFTGSKYEVLVSEDLQTWITYITVNSSTKVWQGTYLTLGYNFSQYPEPMNGYIDLDKTHIFINNSLWFGKGFGRVKLMTKIPGLNNYTVVGSPTINDGIVSGFSASKYLRIDNFSTKYSFEFKTKFKITSSPTGNETIFGVSTSGIFNIGLGSTSKIRILLSTSTSSWNIASQSGDTSLQVNTYYWIKFYFTGSAYKLDLSTDGINYTNEISVTSSTKINSGNDINIFIGNGHTQGWYFKGEIDLNETYIISNDNSWFGKGFGKTKIYSFSGYYEFENGKLIWANPNIYLQYTTNDGNGWFDTGIYGDLDTEIQCKIVRDTATNRKSLWGYGSSTDVPNTLTMYSDGKANCRFSNKTTPSSLDLPMGEEIVIKQNKTALYFNNVAKYNYNATTTFTTTGTLLLCKVGNVTYNTFSGKMYYFKIFKNNVLLMHLVPVPKGLLIGDFVVPSNGMFDIVNQQFYANQGTGTFNIGGLPENYIIKNDNIIWCNDKIYLQNNSSWNAYINTEFVPTNDMRFNIIAQIVDTATHDAALMGSRNGSNNNTAFILWHNRNSTGGGAFLYGKGFVKNWNDIGILGTKNTFIYDGTTFTVNGITPTQGVEINKSIFTSTIPIYLYGFNKSTSGQLEARTFRGRIYSAGLWSNNIIKRYLVPVETGLQIYNYTIPSNGMWDIVNKKFYANAGAGEFIYGKDE